MTNSQSGGHNLGPKECALCGGVPNSLEHIVPRSIGGGIELPILCRDCNSRLGTDLDAHALKSSPVQAAALTIREKVPWLWKRLGHGVAVESMNDNVPLQVEKKTGETRVRPHKDPETGGIWRGDSEVDRRELRKSIKKLAEDARREMGDCAVDPQEIAEKVEALGPNEHLDVPELGARFEQRQSRGIRMKFGHPLPHRYLARIAYFLLVSAGVDSRSGSVDPLRRYVLGEFERPIENGVVISDLPSPSAQYEPWHEVNLQNLRDKLWAVDVCLFGHIAKRFLVFLEPAPHPPFIAIKIDLAKGESLVTLDEDGVRGGKPKVQAWPFPCPDPKEGWPKDR